MSVALVLPRMNLDELRSMMAAIMGEIRSRAVEVACSRCHRAMEGRTDVAGNVSVLNGSVIYAEFGCESILQGEQWLAYVCDVCIAHIDADIHFTRQPES